MVFDVPACKREECCVMILMFEEESCDYLPVKTKTTLVDDNVVSMHDININSKEAPGVSEGLKQK